MVSSLGFPRPKPQRRFDCAVAVIEKKKEWKIIAKETVQKWCLILVRLKHGGMILSFLQTIIKIAQKQEDANSGYYFTKVNSVRRLYWCSLSEQSTPLTQRLSILVSPFPSALIRSLAIPF